MRFDWQIPCRTWWFLIENHSIWWCSPMGLIQLIPIKEAIALMLLIKGSTHKLMLKCLAEIIGPMRGWLIGDCFLISAFGVVPVVSHWKSHELPLEIHEFWLANSMKLIRTWWFLIENNFIWWCSPMGLIQLIPIKEAIALMLLIKGSIHKLMLKCLAEIIGPMRGWLIGDCFLISAFGVVPVVSHWKSYELPLENHSFWLKMSFEPFSFSLCII